MGARARTEWPRAVQAFAPGSIGNVGPGLDVLGLALTGAGDQVTARWTEGTGVHIVDAGHPALPTDPMQHACGIAALAVLRRVRELPDAQLPSGALSLWVTKGLPLSAGQGGSAASAVAAAVAVHALLGEPLEPMALLDCGLEAETAVAGRHLDNLAPSLLGGLVTVLGVEPPDAVRVPVSRAPWFALAYPAVAVRTADARAKLPNMVSRDVLVRQLASVSALVTAFATGDLVLMGRALVDHVAEPARASSVPGFHAAIAAAKAAGAVGGSFSGSGPTTFAVCASRDESLVAAAAMQQAYEQAGLSCTSTAATMDMQGARWTALDR